MKWQNLTNLRTPCHQMWTGLHHQGPRPCILQVCPKPQDSLSPIPCLGKMKEWEEECDQQCTTSLCQNLTETSLWVVHMHWSSFLGMVCTREIHKRKQVGYYKMAFHDYLHSWYQTYSHSALNGENCSQTGSTCHTSSALSFLHIIYNQLQRFIVSIKNILWKTHNMVHKH